MNKPRKLITSAAKTPQNDAEALNTIVSWSEEKDRPQWQREALRKLIDNVELAPDDVDELYTLAIDGTTAPKPITKADVRSEKSTSSVVTLKAVMKPQDVNALASDQSLSFEKAGLTIVYGDNGAGKSGYGRILKQACRARLEAKSAVLANIYDQSPGTPRAQISYTVNGNHKQTEWRADRTSPPELSAVSVFDSRTASVHVDGANTVAYTPYPLELMQRLAQTAGTLRGRCDQEQRSLLAQVPEALRAPPIDAQTLVAQALSGLGAESEIEDFIALVELTQDQTAQLTSLSQDLAGDPAHTAKLLVEQSAGLLRFAGIIAELAENSSDTSLAALRMLLAQKTAAREAADVAARISFAGEPVPDVGSRTWRVLWEAARGFATTAVPGTPFPPQSSTDHCPLCQQALTDEALDRFQRFDAFVKNDTKTRADAADKAYLDRIATLQSPITGARLLRSHLQLIEAKLGDDAGARAVQKVAVMATRQLRQILRAHADPELVVARIDPTQAVLEVQRLAEHLANRAAAIKADANSPERKALVAQLKDLEARRWLKTILPDVELQIERKKMSKVLDRVSVETDTRAITQKANELAGALVTDALRAQFALEIAALGVGDLAVELKKETAQLGAARFRVRLVRKPNAAVGAVLSEGEHRCVALAAFLAELATSGSKSTIIFDDPVSSLDHRNRQHVAVRLSAEAKQRQVIVLTHDVAFLMLLEKAAREQQLSDVGFRCVARGSDHAGYCTNEIPFNARPVDSVLDAIEANVKNRSILFEKGQQAEWRNTVQGALVQVRDSWERSVEEFIGPVLKRLSDKVESRNLAKLTVLDIPACDEMRAGYGTCSALLHTVGESMNPALPTPEFILKEIAKVRAWHAEMRKRQSAVKAAKALR